MHTKGAPPQPPRWCPGVRIFSCYQIINHCSWHSVEWYYHSLLQTYGAALVAMFGNALYRCLLCTLLFFFRSVGLGKLCVMAQVG